MKFSKLSLPPSPTRFFPLYYLCYDPHFATPVHHRHYNTTSSPLCLLQNIGLSLPLTTTPLTISPWLVNPYLLHLLPVMLPRPLPLFTTHLMHPLHPYFLDQQPQNLFLPDYALQPSSHTPFLLHSALQNCN